MGEQDRRTAPRLDFKVPVKLKPVNGPTPYMLTAESINLSEHGVFLSMANPVNVGSPIELSFTMPAEITGGGPMKVRCTARVVRVERDQTAEGKVSVAAHIEHFETIVAEA